MAHQQSNGLDRRAFLGKLAMAGAAVSSLGVTAIGCGHASDDMSEAVSICASKLHKLYKRAFLDSARSRVYASGGEWEPEALKEAQDSILWLAKRAGLKVEPRALEREYVPGPHTDRAETHTALAACSDLADMLNAQAQGGNKVNRKDIDVLIKRFAAFNQLYRHHFQT